MRSIDVLNAHNLLSRLMSVGGRREQAHTAAGAAEWLTANAVPRYVARDAGALDDQIGTERQGDDEE